MNAAVSASVVLASRLSTDVSVFALMLFSIESFALYPMLRHRLQVSWLSRCDMLLLTLPLGISDHHLAHGYSRTLVILRLAYGRSVTHYNVLIFRYSILCDPDRACRSDMGAKIQKVGASFLLPARDG